MQAFGLEANERIGTLSFGGDEAFAAARAGVASTVAGLDEPTTGHRRAFEEGVFGELLGIVRDEARTVLISSHQLSDLERFADRVGVLHRGRLVTEGATAELVERHPPGRMGGGQRGSVCKRAGHDRAGRDGSRWRAVLDTLTCPLAALASRVRATCARSRSRSRNSSSRSSK
jgi:ABC-2 type transport system ATP-binding protein